MAYHLATVDFLHAATTASSVQFFASSVQFFAVEDRGVTCHVQIVQERPDVAYHLVAVDFLPPPVIQASLARLAAEFANGVASSAIHLHSLSDTALPASADSQMTSRHHWQHCQQL